MGPTYLHIIKWNGTAYEEIDTITETQGMLAGVNVGDFDTDGDNEIKACDILSNVGKEWIFDYVKEPDWIEIIPKDGVLQPGEEMNISITIYTENLSENFTSQFIQIDTNDPDESSINIPLYISIISMLTFNFTLFSGWNLITIPVENNLTAKSLLENITGCNIIYAWDALNQTYKVYTLASPDEYNFVIEDGHAYFIGLSANTSFSVTGAPLTNVSVHLYPGWNLIGWFKEEPTTAKSLLENITGCNIIYAWDALNQTYKVYTLASPDEYNFVIKQGDGVFVGVSEESIWHGEG